MAEHFDLMKWAELPPEDTARSLYDASHSPHVYESADHAIQDVFERVGLWIEWALASGHRPDDCLGMRAAWLHDIHNDTERARILLLGENHLGLAADLARQRDSVRDVIDSALSISDMPTAIDEAEIFHTYLLNIHEALMPKMEEENPPPADTASNAKSKPLTGEAALVVRVNLKQSTVVFDGQTYNVKSKTALMVLAAIVKAKGKPVALSSVFPGGHTTTKWRDIRKALPDPIAKMINCNGGPGGGGRLRCS